ncbi:1-acyl-sn-glycerol-3-phosphate acyltransferase [bacterium]|nr:1-acyl-sn-glycerol-3-phosphate acyltransferase [bacterium]
MLRTIWAFIGVGFWTLVIGPIVILGGLMKVSQDFLNKFGIVWSHLILWHCGAKVEIEGLENIDANKTYVFIANHQSHFDIPALLVTIPKQLRMVAKEELFKIIIFGRAIRAAGHISINRQNRKEAVQSMQNIAKRMVDEKICPFIFPEGTRSPDGNLLPFKKGAFTLANQFKAPIIPIAIWGSKNILLKGKLRVNSGKIYLKVLPEISEREVAESDLLAKTQLMFENEISGLRLRG